MCNVKHVFLSHYQATGGDQCMLLRDELLRRGLSVWYDQDESPTIEGMVAGITGAGVVLSFLSQDSLTRPYVHLELQTALEHKKALVFVHEADPANGGEALLQIKDNGRAFLFDDRSKGPKLRPEEFNTLVPLFYDKGQPGYEEPLPFSRGADFAGMMDALEAKIRARIPHGHGAPPPPRPPLYELPAAAPSPRLLLVSGALGGKQLEYLRAAICMRCPGVSVRLMCGEWREDTSDLTAASHALLTTRMALEGLTRMGLDQLCGARPAARRNSSLSSYGFRAFGGAGGGGSPLMSPHSPTELATRPLDDPGKAWSLLDRLRPGSNGYLVDGN